MPGMDGFSCTEAIRKKEAEDKSARLYIVALTANVLQQHKEQAMAAGMDDFLPKPLKRESLIQSIEQFLQTHQQ